MKRFWSKVIKSNGCWIWQGALAGSGYGVFRGPNQRMIGAHRMAYILTRGSIPQGINVLHHCDNKRCVCPEHLFLGTQKDNMDDMICKGRQATGDQLNHCTQVGEANHSHKLSESEVKQIRCLYQKGYRQCDIARLVGVEKANVWAIVHGKSWNQVG
jgi:hypothetical protein